jgi:hypothetical protein
MKVVRLSALRTGRLYRKKYSWYSFLLEAESNPRAIVQLEGLCQCKTAVTTSGIESATFRLVAQCLNQLQHRVPLNLCVRITIRVGTFGINLVITDSTLTVNRCFSPQTFLFCSQFGPQLATDCRCIIGYVHGEVSL